MRYSKYKPLDTALEALWTRDLDRWSIVCEIPLPNNGKCLCGVEISRIYSVFCLDDPEREIYGVGSSCCKQFNTDFKKPKCLICTKPIDRRTPHNGRRHQACIDEIENRYKRLVNKREEAAGRPQFEKLKEQKRCVHCEKKLNRYAVENNLTSCFHCASAQCPICKNRFVSKNNYLTCYRCHMEQKKEINSDFDSDDE